MFKRIISGVLNTFLPAVCFNCKQPIRQAILCPDCMEKIRFLTPPFCRNCSQPIGDNSSGLCGACYGKKSSLDQVICLTAYQEPLTTLIPLFKYQHHRHLIIFFNQIIYRRLRELSIKAEQYDYLSYVPMHPAKRKSRDYNHARLLAQIIAKYFKIDLRDDIIYENKKLRHQAGLHRNQRQANIMNAFICKKDLTNRKILIIDDVFTTGATLRACAKSLKKNGASIVNALTLSKTL